MLRELTLDEVEAVSGGHYNEDSTPSVFGNNDRPGIPMVSIGGGLVAPMYNIDSWDGDHSSSPHVDSDGVDHYTVTAQRTGYQDQGNNLYARFHLVDRNGPNLAELFMWDDHFLGLGISGRYISLGFYTYVPSSTGASAEISYSAGRDGFSTGGSYRSAVSGFTFNSVGR
jgi:hypothetical protein